MTRIGWLQLSTQGVPALEVSHTAINCPVGYNSLPLESVGSCLCGCCEEVARWGARIRVGLIQLLAQGMPLLEVSHTAAGYSSGHGCLHCAELYRPVLQIVRLLWR